MQSHVNEGLVVRLEANKESVRDEVDGEPLV